MSDACRTPGCTIGETGVCLLNNNPATCEHRIDQDLAAVVSVPSDSDYASPVLDTPEERPTLWGSLPLEVAELRDLMGTRRCLLVGVLGTPAAGKTAALVSMYLLLAHGALDGFQFADSRSLMAFEEISQGARLWGLPPPEEMTARTEITSSRAAGFLHIRIKRLSDGKLIDLLVPDLPGEWSDALIDNNRTDRLDFLHAAQVVWVFVNGAELRQSSTRMHTISRTNLLVRRLASTLGENRLPIKIVVSHADAGALPTVTVDRLKKILADADLGGEVIEIASFSSEDAVPAGTGISKLIDASLPVAPPPSVEWPSNNHGDAHRFMLRYSEGDLA